MWAAVLMMALGAATDPFRMGLVFLLMSRRRPLANLLAFWLGGMTTGIGLAMAVLLAVHDFALVVVQNLTSTVGGFVSGRTEVTIGVLVLLAAVYVATRHRKPVPVGGGDASAPTLQPSTPTVFSWVSARARGMLTGGFIWPAYLAGIGSVTPPVESVVVFTIIMASGATIGFQVGAFVAWTVVVLAIVEIPLVSYLMAPDKTQAMMLRLQNWTQAHRWQVFQVGLVSLGVMLVVKGVRSL
jgi:Sap, sulfolipid-1-addressing protein